MDLKTLEGRYRNDQTFHALVKNLEMLIEHLEMTPSEVREAAMYATIRVESRRQSYILEVPGRYNTPPAFVYKCLNVPCPRIVQSKGDVCKECNAVPK